MEIVFSDSAKGSLKLAQRYDEKHFWTDGPTAHIGKRPSEEELRRMWAGAPLTGSTGDVAGLSFMLDVGDISGDIIGEQRTEAIFWLWGFAFDSREDRAFQEFFQNSVNDLQKAKRAAKQGEGLRVWCSATPASECGLRHLMWEIRGCDCPVSVVELPRYWKEESSLITYVDWNEVQPGRFYQFLKLERAVELEERHVLAAEWRELVSENAPLRAVINGRLTSVGEDFYDPLLRACMTDEPMHMGRLIGNVLGKYSVGVSDSWYARRIRAMIESGELKVIDAGDGSHPYSATIQRA